MRLIFRFIALASLLAAFGAVLPPFHFLIEIAANFGGYIVLALTASMIIFATGAAGVSQRARTFWFVVCLVLLILYLKPFFPFYAGEVQFSQPHISEKKRIRVLYANLYGGNRRLTEAVDTIASKEPDCAVLLEVNDGSVRAVRERIQFAYRIAVPRTDYFGIAIFCREPLVRIPLELSETFIPPIIIAQVRPAEMPTITLVALHAVPPLSNQALSTNQLLLRRAAAVIRERTHPEVMVAGDFNATPFSSFYKNFIEWTELRNAAFGYGYQRTWHAERPSLRFMIDHIMIAGDLVTESFERIAIPGSDHYGLVVDVKAAGDE